MKNTKKNLGKVRKLKDRGKRSVNNPHHRANSGTGFYFDPQTDALIRSESVTNVYKKTGLNVKIIRERRKELNVAVDETAKKRGKAPRLDKARKLQMIEMIKEQKYTDREIATRFECSINTVWRLRNQVLGLPSIREKISQDFLETSLG